MCIQPPPIVATKVYRKRQFSDDKSQNPPKSESKSMRNLNFGTKPIFFVPKLQLKNDFGKKHIKDTIQTWVQTF